MSRRSIGPSVASALRAGIRSFSQGLRAKDVVGEIATRAASWDFLSLVGLLPDPDPVLRKRGDDASVLEDLTGDDQVTSAMQTRKITTLTHEWRWEPGKGPDEEPSDQAVQLRDRLMNDLGDMDVYNINAQILDAPYYGIVPLELMWQPDSGALRLSDVRALPQRWFGFNETNEPRFRTKYNAWDGIALPPGKFVFARHFPTYDNPYGLRLLSRCFWPVTFKRGGIKFWVQFAEKFGMPFLVGKAREGADEDEMNTIVSRLAQMVQDAVAAVPNGTDVEIVAGGNTGSYAVHERLKEAMDAAISKVLLGQTLTMQQGDRGARSLGEVHERILTSYAEADRMLVQQTWNRIARVYAEVNAEGVLPPIFRWYEEEDLHGGRAERDAKLNLMGVRFSRAYFTRVYGFEDDDIDEVSAAAASPNPFGFSERPPSPAQQTVDQFVAQQIAKGANVTERQAKAILSHVQASESFEELISRLELAHDELGDDLARVVQEAAIAADMYGRYTVQAEMERDV